jgi:hypothetical protein
MKLMPIWDQCLKKGSPKQDRIGEPGTQDSDLSMDQKMKQKQLKQEVTQKT